MVIVTSSAIDCDVISKMKTEQVRHGNDGKRSLFLSLFMNSLCCVRNKIMYVLLWQTVSVLTRVLFWYLFPSLLRNWGYKHQNNPLVSTEKVCCSRIYIILYIFIVIIIVFTFIISKYISLNERFVNFDWNFVRYVPHGLIDNDSALFQGNGRVPSAHYLKQCWLRST